MSVADEIRRVVWSPYSVSLKPLDDALRVLDGWSLQRWADDHPCQIGALVQAILEGLEHCPHALSILEKLARVGSIRDAVLSQKPILLDALLRKVATCHQGYDQYSATCVVLLSQPLPAGIGTPSTLLPFFSRLLDAAIESPSAVTIKPVYSLLTCRQSTLIELLPSKTLRNFQERLLQVLKRADEQSVNLLCLGVFARLAAGRRSRTITGNGGFAATDVDASSTATGLEPIDQFFNEKRAFKTIQLVVLRVILACSESSKVSVKDGLETLALAIEISDAVETVTKMSWLVANQATMQKLYEKICRPALPAELQSLALEFILSLGGSERLPPRLVSLFQTLISNGIHPTTAFFSVVPLSMRVLEGFMTRVDEPFTCSVLREALVACVEQVQLTATSSGRSRYCSKIVHALRSTALKSPLLWPSISFSISNTAISGLVRLLVQFSLPHVQPTRCDDAEACPTIAIESRRELCSSICSLFLEGIIRTPIRDHAFDMQLAVDISGKQLEFAVPTAPCHFIKVSRNEVRSEQIPLLEQTSTPQDPSASRNWRERLAADLSRDAARTHEIIVRMIGEVCRDLEDRCLNVVAPLREEHAKVTTLQEELCAAECKISRLEVEAADRELLLSGSEAERIQLKDKVKGLETELHRSVLEGQQLQEGLEKTLHRLNADLKETGELAEQEKLKHLALSSIKDETIDELREELQELKKRLEDFQVRVEDLKNEKAEAREQIELLEERTRSQAKQMALESASATRREETIRGLQDLEQSLRASIEALRGELQISAAHSAALIATLQGTEKSLRAEKDDLCRAQESDAANAAAQEAQLRQSHQVEIEQMQTQWQLERHRASLEQESKRSKILELEARIGGFERDRLAKAKEFAEAQELSRRLMTVMGASSTYLAPKSSNYGTPDFDDISFNLPATQSRENVDRRPSPVDRRLSPAQAVFLTSPKHGRTSKRSRPRKSSRTASLSPTNTADSIKAMVKVAHPVSGLRPDLGSLGLRESSSATNRGLNPTSPRRETPKCHVETTTEMMKSDNAADAARTNTVDLENIWSGDQSEFLTSTQSESPRNDHPLASDSLLDDTTMDL